MNRKISLLLSIVLTALLVIVPHRAMSACGTLPNTFVNGVSTVDANTTNANNNFLVACAKNVDNTQIGTAGIYASQIIPTNTTQATFGGSQLYTFPNGVTITSGGLIVTAGGETISTFTSSGIVTNNSSGVLASNATIGQSFITNGYVDLSSAQTVGGAKTFSSAVTISSGGLTVSAGGIADTGSSTIIGALNVGPSGNCAVATTGDIAACRSTTTGLIALGGTGASGQIDYNITTANIITANTTLADSSQLLARRGGAANVTYVAPFYTQSGGVQANTAHISFASCSTSASTSCTATFTGDGVFTSATTYACSTTATNANQGYTFALASSGSAVNLNSQLSVTQTIDAVCIGT